MQFNSIITGSLLGDGSIPKSKFNSHFSKNQKYTRYEYLKWHYDQLNLYSSRLKESTSSTKGKSYKRWIFATKSNEIFTQLRKKWYPKNKKIVPKDIVLDPLSIAIWFCDDGYNNVKKNIASFATYCFSKKDCNFLISKFKEFNIKARLSKQNVIFISGHSYEILIDLIKDYVIWDCFKYKIERRENVVHCISDKTAKQIAEKLKISYAVVFNVLNGKTHKHLNLSIKNKNLPINNTSGIKGLYWDKSRNKWMVFVKKHYGRFNSKKEAMACLEKIKVVPDKT